MQISEGDRNAIKARLVPLMIALGSKETTMIQAQIGEGLSTIAEMDFPDQWEGLVDVSLWISNKYRLMGFGRNWSPVCLLITLSSIMVFSLLLIPSLRGQCRRSSVVLTG